MGQHCWKLWHSRTVCLVETNQMCPKERPADLNKLTRTCKVGGGSEGSTPGPLYICTHAPWWLAGCLVIYPWIPPTSASCKAKRRLAGWLVRLGQSGQAGLAWADGQQNRLRVGSRAPTHHTHVHLAPHGRRACPALALACSSS